MSKLYLDLSKLYNHRAETSGIGTPGEDNYLKLNSLSFNQCLKNGEVECIFRKASNGDNVICDSQILDINNILIKKITLFGFCVWGYYKEKFILKYRDQTEGIAVAYFSDVVYPLTLSINNVMGIDRQIYMEGSQVFCDFIWDQQKGFMYYSTTEFENATQVNKIIFPDNCLMHIFAITIEN
jgi:hypothetical protein